MNTTVEIDSSVEVRTGISSGFTLTTGRAHVVGHVHRALHGPWHGHDAGQQRQRGRDSRDTADHLLRRLMTEKHDAATARFMQADGR